MDKNSVIILMAHLYTLTGAVRACGELSCRGKGKSAVAAAAYRAGEKITNEYDGITHDYTRKGGEAIRRCVEQVLRDEPEKGQA